MGCRLKIKFYYYYYISFHAIFYFSQYILILSTATKVPYAINNTKSIVDMKRPNGLSLFITEIKCNPYDMYKSEQ